AQVTRVTASSGRWLPLRSDTPGFVNTKPPLLFWQGIVTTGWGRRWTLLSLRWPSAAWTMLTALLAGLLAWRATGRDPATGCLAAAAYLAFLSTYRYGRPFLTNPPETFWMFLCPFVMAWWRPFSFASRLLFPTLVGAIVGMALLTKSFALLLPVGLALAWWQLRAGGWRWRTFLHGPAWCVAWTAAVALGMFSLWFLLDPDPAAIWREFVVRENVDKLAGGRPSYLGALLWGRKCLWGYALGFFLNGGLLAFPLAGTLIRGWQHRGEASEDERLLWIWVIVFLVVFALPTERTSRYLIDAMPAVAVLMAIHWRRLLPQAFATTLVGSAAVVLAVAWLSVVVSRPGDGDGLQGSPWPWWHWAILSAAIAPSIVTLADRRRLPDAAVPAAAGALLAVSAFLTAFDAPLGVFPADAIAAAAGRVVWAPEGFIATTELDRMLLPGATVRGYPAADGQPAPGTAAGGDLVIVTRGLEDPAPAAAIGSRLELASRHTGRQLVEMATGRLREHLFRREWLVPAGSLDPPSGDAEP
ncbi:MAG: glycosyl transferase family 39, partial [Planctomycetia bacterium]|nr:glycosyl transferase family 39 [Planctomycetia bacterium]